jgi:hypothetical protein
MSSATNTLTTGLLAVAGIGLAIYCWPMSDADVPRYISVVRLVEGRHNSAFTPGPSPVVTLAVRNSHSWRDSPTNLWVACGASGTVDDVGSFVNKLVTFDAEPVYTVGGSGHAVQYVPAGRTVNLDFQTQAGMPSHDLRAGETVTEPCVIGVDQEQAMARAGHRENGPETSGQWVDLTQHGRNLGFNTKRN